MARAVPELPAALSALQPVLNRMLAKSPDARYPDMAAMLLDVSRHLLRAPELLRAPPGMPQVSPTERLHQLGFLTTGMHAVQAAASTQVLGKGVKAPNKGLRMAAVAVAALTLGALAFGLWSRIQSPATPPAPAAAAFARADNSIAVLPFVSMSTDKDQEFFADGISEELLNQLAKIPELRVISRTSSFAFKGKDVGVGEIARQLGVAHVLEGSIRRSGDKVRITAQLVRTSDSSHLWSETYDRELTDIFAVQDEISQAVVGQLKVKLLGGAPKAAAVNPEAYALFLEARSFSRLGTAAGLQQANDLLEKAIRIDPAYARAWTGISRNHAFFATRIAGVDSAEHVRLSRAAANKALAIDPDYAPARVALASLSIDIDRDLPGGVRQMEEALRLAPEDSAVLSTAGSLLAALGRRREALALTESLAARDPANPTPFISIGQGHFESGRFDEAIAAYRKALQLNPTRPTAHYGIADCLIAKGEPRAALAEIQLEPEDSPWRKIGLPVVWHALGEDANAEAALAELIRDLEKDAAYNIAYVQAQLGHADATFEWLDKAVAYKDPGLAQILFDERGFAAVRDDPRWLKFLESIGRAPGQLAAIKFDTGPITRLDAAKP
jgi:TolB-like protein/tetratricopeptide (TPR) repeat protein